VPTGTVKWYDPEKGYGFITRDDGGDDLFVHRSALGYEQLQEGDRVSFAVGYGQKGENAVDVSVTEKSTLPPRPRPTGDRFGAAGFAPRGGGWAARGPAVDPTTLPLLTGVVRRYDPERGFGFIQRDDAAGDDVFFHRSAAGDGLGEGDKVEFRLGAGPKGPRAETVRLLEKGAGAAFGGSYRPAYRR